MDTRVNAIFQVLPDKNEPFLLLRIVKKQKLWTAFVEIIILIRCGRPKR